MKLYLLIVVLLIWTSLVFGLFAPWLISAPSTVAFALGAVLLVVYFPSAFYLCRTISRLAKPIVKPIMEKFDA